MTHARTRTANAGRRAFTLVELLVVIGVITLLVALLLPALSGARDMARTLRCLANLRQLGHGIQMYADANGGCVVPAGYMGRWEGYGSPGGADWAGILVHGKYLPGGTGLDQRDTVLRCPSGSDEIVFRALIIPPASPWDPAGATGTYSYDDINDEFTANWYAVNCVPNWAPELRFGYHPFRLLPVLRDDWSEDYSQTRIYQFRNASRLAMVFDGLSMIWCDDPSYINARHKRRTVTNVLMADGHAESMDTHKVLNSGYINRFDDEIQWHPDQVRADR